MGQKSQKIPSFTAKTAPNRHPPKRWVLFMSWHFVLFCFFVFFPPDSSYFPLFLDILKPKWPTKGGYRLYGSIYTHIPQLAQHININFLVRLPEGFTALCCPRDKHSLSWGHAQFSPNLTQLKPSLSPGTNAVCSLVCPGDKRSLFLGRSEVEGRVQNKFMH